MSSRLFQFSLGSEQVLFTVNLSSFVGGGVGGEGGKAVWDSLLFMYSSLYQNAEAMCIRFHSASGIVRVLVRLCTHHLACVCVLLLLLSLLHESFLSSL